MPRFAFSEPSIGSTTTTRRAGCRGGRPPRRRSSTSRSRRRARIASSAALSTAVVSSPPRPCADDRLALGPRRQLLEDAPRRPRPRRGRRASQSVTAGGRAGRSSASDRRTCSSAASPRRGRAISHTSSIRVGRRRNAASASPRSTAATASRAYGVYVTPSRREPVDDLGVERRRPRAARSRPAGRARGPGSSSPGARRSACRSRRSTDSRDRDASGRSSGLPGRSARSRPSATRFLGAVLLVEGERRLVAVVAVGDQELRVRELLGERVAELGVETPEARTSRRPPPRRCPARRGRRPRSSRPRAGRSARAGCASPRAAADAPPSARRACARAGGSRGSRTARPAARRRSPRACARRRRARRSAARATSTPARASSTSTPAAATLRGRAQPAPPRRAASGGRRCAGSRARYSSRCSSRDDVVGRRDDVGELGDVVAQGRRRGGCWAIRLDDNRSVRIRAAVLEEFGAPLEVQEVDLAEPQAGEVLVRLVACGVCHTDLYTASGADPSGYAPTVLGHEGAGVVERVGRGRRVAAARRPRGDALLAAVPRVRPLPRSAHESLPRDPRAAGQGLSPRRDDAAFPRRRAGPALHGHVDVRRVHGDARDRAREDHAGGAARPRLRLRLRSLDRARRGAEHGEGAAGVDLRRLRRRARRARRGRRLPAAGRGADRLRRPLRRSGSSSRAARARRTCRRRARRRAADPRADGGFGADYTFEATGQRRRDAAGGRGGAHGLGARNGVRRRRQGRDARRRAALPDHRPPRSPGRRSAASRGATRCRSSSSAGSAARSTSTPLISHRISLDEVNRGFELMEAQDGIRSGSIDF